MDLWIIVLFPAEAIFVRVFIVFLLGFWLRRVRLASDPTMPCRCDALCKLRHSS
jgi:hypothetical protein